MVSQRTEGVGKMLWSLFPSPPSTGCQGVLREERQTGAVHAHMYVSAHTENNRLNLTTRETQSASGELSSLVRSQALGLGSPGWRCQAPLLRSCVTLGKWLNLSEPRAPHIQNGYKYRIYS